MAWQTTVHPHVPVIELRYSGLVSPAELVAAAQAALDLMHATQMRLLLADCTTILGGHSLFDLYGLADLVLASDMAHTLREAIIMPPAPELADSLSFWETTCFNRGITVRIFSERQAALDWLLQTSSAARVS